MTSKGIPQEILDLLRSVGTPGGPSRVKVLKLGKNGIEEVTPDSFGDAGAGVEDNDEDADRFAVDTLRDIYPKAAAMAQDIQSMSLARGEQCLRHCWGAIEDLVSGDEPKAVLVHPAFLLFHEYFTHAGDWSKIQACLSKRPEMVGHTAESFKEAQAATLAKLRS